MITSIRYEAPDGKRGAAICRPVSGSGWEVHMLRYWAKSSHHTRRRRVVPTLTHAQAVARVWCADGIDIATPARTEGGRP